MQLYFYCIKSHLKYRLNIDHKKLDLIAIEKRFKY